MLRHNVILHQHDVEIAGVRYPSTMRHPTAVGDTVITLGAHPRKYGDWVKAKHDRIETEIAAEVARRLGLSGLLGKNISVKTVSHNQMIRIEITRPTPTVYGWEEIEKYIKDGIVLGRDQLRQPIMMDFERGVPGYLVTGASRSGKTNFLRSVIAQALHKGYEVYLTHLKPGGVKDYADILPYISHHATDEEGALRILAHIEQRVVSRNKLEESSEKRILFIWDEASEPFTPSEMQERLGALAKGAGSSNVFMLIGVQNATNSVHKDVRYNLVNRIAFRASPQMASHNTGQKDSGIDKFHKGEALVITEGFAQRITTPRAEKDDIRGLLETVTLVRKEIKVEQRTREKWWAFVFARRYLRPISFDELRALRKARGIKGRLTKDHYNSVLGWDRNTLPTENPLPLRNPLKWIPQWR